VAAALSGLVLTLTAARASRLLDLRSAPAALVVASLPIVLIGVLGAERLYFARFLLPAIPALLVMAALALDRLFNVYRPVGVLAALIVVLPTAADALRFDALLTNVDTRTLAHQWIDRTLPGGAIIAVDSAPLGPTLSSEQGHQLLVANDWSLFDLSPADYRARGVGYVVVSSFTSEARAIDPTREARRLAFVSAISAESTLVAQFRPYVGEVEPPFIYDQIYGPFNNLDRLQRPGPTINVFQLE